MRPKYTGETSAQVHTVQDAVAATFDQANANGLMIKALAQDTRIPGSRLYEIYEGRKRLWAEEIPVLVRATGSHLVLDVIARACGGTFVPLPSSPSVLEADLRVASDAMHEFAQTIQAYSSAVADGRITRDEAEQVTREGHEAIAAILSLMQHAQNRAAATTERVAR